MFETVRQRHAKDLEMKTASLPRPSGWERQIGPND